MYKAIFAAAALIVALVSLAYASQERPSLMDCGETLPEDAHFSITMHGDWDARETPAAGSISITLKDEVSGETPQEIPESAEALVKCVKAAVGV
jgi:hypothetical protein